MPPANSLEDLLKEKTEPFTGAKRGQIRCLLNLLDWESGGLKGFEGGVSLQKPLCFEEILNIFSFPNSPGRWDCQYVDGCG